MKPKWSRSGAGNEAGSCGRSGTTTVKARRQGIGCLGPLADDHVDIVEVEHFSAMRARRWSIKRMSPSCRPTGLRPGRPHVGWRAGGQARRGPLGGDDRGERRLADQEGLQKQDMIGEWTHACGAASETRWRLASRDAT